MERLNNRQIVGIKGGSLLDFFDGFCAIAGGASLLSLVVKATPVGGYITAGCAVYGIVRWATS